MRGRHAECLPHRFDALYQRVLHDEGARLAVLRNEADFRGHQPEIQRHGHQSGVGQRHVDLHPFHAVVGQHGDPIPVAQTEPAQAG